MELRINGEPREVVDDLSLLELIKQLKLPADRIAIELNRSVVRRAEWAGTVLKDDDRVEIVHFVGGGLAEEAVGRGSRQAVFDAARFWQPVLTTRWFCFNSFRCKVRTHNLSGEVVRTCRL